MFSNIFKKNAKQMNSGVEENVLDKNFDYVEELSDMESSSVVGGSLGYDIGISALNSTVYSATEIDSDSSAVGNPHGGLIFTVV